MNKQFLHYVQKCIFHFFIINIYNYSQTHFFKFCIIIGSDKLVPWMEDYTINWTDEKLYKYFNLSEDDIKIINKETEYYFNKKKK